MVDMFLSYYILIIVDFLYDDSIPYWKGFGYVVYLFIIRIGL